jgi:hypothetical protein
VVVSTTDPIASRPGDPRPFCCRNANAIGLGQCPRESCDGFVALVRQARPCHIAAEQAHARACPLWSDHGGGRGSRRVEIQHVRTMPMPEVAPFTFNHTGGDATREEATVGGTTGGGIR